MCQISLAVKFMKRVKEGARYKSLGTSLLEVLET
jgi:hypothetical protein